ncbi:uncharacterized protein LOC143894801 [Temnothorax americanus]|uniref:uncharacterized protein LOC143894801 n=1 Tax=Temnothorax americanus TaxID=1964332 RepID=UPI0040681806
MCQGTASNISKSADTLEESDQSLEVTTNIRSAKRSSNLKEKSAIERIANAFCDASNNDDIVLPPPLQPDVDLFLNLLGSRIRRLSEAQKQEAFQKLLQLSYDMR